MGFTKANIAQLVSAAVFLCSTLNAFLPSIEAWLGAGSGVILAVSSIVQYRNGQEAKKNGAVSSIVQYRNGQEAKKNGA